MRLAHFSDVHVTLPPLSAGLGALLAHPKRLAGASSYHLGGRRRHFAGAEARIAALLEDLDAQGVDHAICTGDLTAVAHDEEMRRAAALFGERLRDPARFTALPGNHDRYVEERGERVFERYFSTIADEGRGYPYEKRLAPGVRLIVIDTTRPTSLLDSSGRMGEAQRAALEPLLAPSEDMVLLALHYGILRADGRPDRPRHGLRDAELLLPLLEEGRVHLVLHGHMHRAYAVAVGRARALCAGSATDLHVACGYQIYELDPRSRGARVERRVWRDGRYVAEPAQV